MTTYGKTAQDAMRDKIARALAETLDGQEAMHCTRVWEAWSVGTMSEDDFAHVTDDHDAFNEIVDAVLAVLDAETEWEYGYQLQTDTGDIDNTGWSFESLTDAREMGERRSAEENEAFADDPDMPDLKCVVVRRRKASPWEPVVEGEER